MSRHGLISRGAGRTACLALAVAVGLGPARALAQRAAPDRPPAVVSAPAPAHAAPPGAAVVEGGDEPGAPVLPLEVQIVRFHAPEKVKLEVLGPNPEPVPVGDGHGVATVGLRVGVPYRLRLSDLSGGREGADLYPVIEIVGHLHRPAGIDPSRYPIRIAFTENDFVDAVDHGRLVTQVVYLEDPEHALPITLPKDEIPVVTVSPAEEPLRVASALGRVMAIVRMGGRKPTVDELSGGPSGLGLSGMPTPSPCPFIGPGGGRCPLPCGPVQGHAPEAGRIWLPRDEFLCDGGDRGEPIHFAGDGGLRGIDPRDAVIEFNDGRRPRVLPTNLVCVYAPRCAEVRVSVGPNEALAVEALKGSKTLERQAGMAGLRHSNKLVQNQGAEANLVRARASALRGRVYAGEHEELRVLGGYDTATHLAVHVLNQGAEKLRIRQKPGRIRERNRIEGIRTAEGAKLTGIIQGAGEKVMSWKPNETVGVETPPNRPGLAVIKRVSAGEAEAGDVLTFAIQYRNMGNTPIRSVTVTDSLLPRLGYVPGSAQGPKGTVFTAGENRAGSTELRWELPGAIPPGGEGYVSFQAVVR
jgi:uncharacterized repeat protein (TIGR01451 family)